MNASDLAPTYDFAVIGGGPAGLAAASLAARAGLSTVLFDENPGVGGQIYRAITSTPVTDRTILGEDYWAGAELAAEAKASGASIVTGATVWSLDPQRIVGVSIGGKARMIAARRVIIATGSQERPFPIPGWTLPGVMTAGGAQTALKAQGLLPAGRTVIAGTGPLLWLLAAQIQGAGRSRRQDRGCRQGPTERSGVRAGRWRAPHRRRSPASASGRRAQRQP